MTGRRQEWLVEPNPPEVTLALARLSRTRGVERIAVMPDVHLAASVCVGVATASRDTLLPEAVGGDIGCGITCAAFHVEAARLGSPSVARAIMDGLVDAIPERQHAGPPAVLPELLREPLSAAPLDRRRKLAARQLGTVGRGNHFVELQADGEGKLWAMLHSGSRGMGPAIRDHHLRRQGPRPTLDVDEDAGQAYLRDHDSAVRYAHDNRRQMLGRQAATLEEVIGECPRGETFDCHHNFVRQEDGLWVHRKGVVSARTGELGVVAGSMGAPSYHVEGRGVAAALCSCSHGAGRRMSRSEARRVIDDDTLVRQMAGGWFDNRRLRSLRDEAPGAYKDIGRVMRAQRELVRIRRVLTPLLSFKGGA